MIPKPNPDLPEALWVEAVMKRVCVHVALEAATQTVGYRLPYCAHEWCVCEACADELDRRFLQFQLGHYRKVGPIGRVTA